MTKAPQGQMDCLEKTALAAEVAGVVWWPIGILIMLYAIIRDRVSRHAEAENSQNA